MEELKVTLGVLGFFISITNLVFVIYDRLKKVELNTYFSPNITANYTTRGFYFLVSGVFIARKKDTTIKKIDLHIETPSGAKIDFVWDSIDDRYAMPFYIEKEKNTNPKNIDFRQKGYKEQIDDLRYKLEQKVRESNNNIKQTQEYKNLRHEYETFTWTKGKYRATFIIEATNLRQPLIKELYFDLSQDNIDKLRENKVEIEKHIDWLISNPRTTESNKFDGLEKELHLYLSQDSIGILRENKIEIEKHISWIVSTLKNPEPNNFNSVKVELSNIKKNLK